jgi:TonB family protein
MRIAVTLVALATILAAPARSQTCAPSPAGPPPTPAQAAERVVREALTDTLRRAFLEAARASGVAEPSGIAIIQVDARGAPAAVRVHRGNVAPAVLRPVADAHAAQVTRWPRRGGYVHVRLDPADTSRGAMVECSPAPRNTQPFIRDVQRIVADNLGRGRRPGRDAKLLMLVTRDGEVAFAEIVESTGWERLDRDLERAALRLRFLPATLAGMPVDVFVEQPVQL